MKYNTVSRSDFMLTCSRMNDSLEGAVTLHIFKRFVIGAIIDHCFYNGVAFIYDRTVYTVENTDRSGYLYDVLYNTEADTINEWINAVSTMI